MCIRRNAVDISAFFALPFGKMLFDKIIPWIVSRNGKSWVVALTILTACPAQTLRKKFCLMSLWTEGSRDEAQNKELIDGI